MAANPIFPLYYNDIDRSTRDWTDEEFGCYMRLLMHQWAQGQIPKETQRLARIAPSVTQNWNLLKPKFTETETGLINERLEEIRDERNAFSKKQSNNGKNGGRPSNNPKETQKKPKNNPNKNPNESLHSEYENEQENENDLKGGVGGKFFDALSDSEITLTIEFIHRLGFSKKILQPPDIKNYWEAFLKVKDDFYYSRSKVINHFRNWLKKQDINHATDSGNNQLSKVTISRKSAGAQQLINHIKEGLIPTGT